ncbi:transcription factor SPT20 homolog [Cavia porcellus]|uniref:transcription factor SPT20 homolog n=1 Tax=Cavia porcellus TaxID=10141 RepID=UPI002FE2F1B7
MQRGLEQALDRADEVIAGAQQRPPARRVPWAEGKSLHEKLYDIYVEECGKEPEVTEELTASVHLLEKLVSRESLPCLVFNLYPGDKGYSVMLDDKSGSFVETTSLPYEESKLLEYLDAQQLPPVLLDVLDATQVNFFHSGCVIAEIRDYRQCVDPAPSVYKSRHILLRPTMQTLVCDVEAIARENPRWTQKDKLALESQLILATAEPVCLNPSVAVACTANRLLFNMQKMNTAPMQQCFKRHSWPALSQQKSSVPSSSPPSTVLTACKKVTENHSNLEHNLKITEQNYIDMWKQRPCDLAMPSEIDVQKHAKGKESSQSDDELLTFSSPLIPEDNLTFDYETDSQLEDTKPSMLMSNNDPFWCDRIEPQFLSLKKLKQRAPAATVTSSSRSSSSGQDPPAHPVSSTRKFPPLAPGPKPSSLSQKPSVTFRGVSSLSAPTQPCASHSGGVIVTQNPASSTNLKVIHVVGPAQRAQVLVSGSESMQRSTIGAPTAGGTQPSNLQPSSAGSGGTQPPSQPNVQIILQNAVGLSPVTILQLPPGSIIVNTPPYPQQQQPLPQIQPQPPSQPQVYQFITQPQPQQPTATLLTQPSPQVSVPGLGNQQWVLPAGQDIVINLTGEGRFVQPQATVLSQPASGQQISGQRFPSQRVQVPPVGQQRVQGQRQVQSHHVRYWRRPSSIATTTTQTTGSTYRSHAKGSSKKSPPPTPKP